jgi:hypothetical protein
MRCGRCGEMGRLLKILALVGLVLSARPAEGAIPTLRDSLKGLAQEILNVVKKDQNQTSIAIDDTFSAPPGFDANGGPGISEALKSLLQELDPGVVQKRAFLSLRGRYDKSQDPRDSSLILVKVTAEIIDQNGKRVDEKVAEVRDTGMVAELLGATVALPPAASREKRNEILRQIIDKPSYTPAGTEIKSAPDRPFGVEILVTSKDQAPQEAKGWANVPARAPRDEDGQPFVDIKRDEVYAIRIHNDFEYDGTKYEAAVAVAIDGIDVFTFSEIRNPKTKQPKYTHYVCPPGQSTIPGWHKTNERSDSFLVTEYGKGAVSKLANASRGKVGVITVRFALAWTGGVIPEAEKGARDVGNETGFGPPTKTELQEVARQVGVVRDVINVHYAR